ncbi:MAG: hypothetical protein MR021_00580 [Clostridiales bacterium]|nr:hypothetical protein [Clostridiales bacterium]
MGVFGCALLMALMLMNPGDSARAAGEALRVWALQVTPALYPALCCMLYIAPRLPGRPAVGAALGILSGSPGGARVCAAYPLTRAAARRLAAGTGVMSPLFFLTVLAGWLQSPVWAARVYVCHLAGAWAAALLLPGGGKRKKKKRHGKRVREQRRAQQSAPGNGAERDAQRLNPGGAERAARQGTDGRANGQKQGAQKKRRKTGRVVFFGRAEDGRGNGRRGSGATEPAPGQIKAPGGSDRAEGGRENGRRGSGTAEPAPGQIETPGGSDRAGDGWGNGRRESGAAGPVPGLFEAMSAAAAALLTVAGCIMLGTVASALAGKYLSGTAPWVAAALQSALEVTGGVRALCALDASVGVRSVLCAFFTSFGGLSLLMQNSAFWQKRGLDAASLLPLRLLHGTLSALMCLLWSRAV